MGRPYNVALLLQQGLNPVEIADQLQISLSSTLGYLDRAIGDGLIRRSDIYFSIPSATREDPTPDYHQVLERYRNGASAYGDMYEDLRSIELSLHERVRHTLEDVFGTDELSWWRKGVPQSVREKCVTRREKDTDTHCDPYLYTDLIDLSLIIDKNWKHFVDDLSAFSHDKPGLKEDLRRLNSIRNRVMHPIRELPPTEEEFDFVRSLKSRLAST